MIIDDETLARWKRLESEATPGPWAFDPREPHPSGSPPEIPSPHTPGSRCDMRVYGIAQEGATHYAWGGGYPIVETDSGCYGPCVHDAALIVAARNAFPSLIAEVERLKREVERLRDAVVGKL